jgi:hypothetical protein
MSTPRTSAHPAQNHSGACNMKLDMFDIACSTLQKYKEHEILHGEKSPLVISMFNNWVDFVLDNFDNQKIILLFRVALIDLLVRIHPEDVPRFDEIHKIVTPAFFRG